MGTNYYAIPKVNKELRKQIIDKVLIDDFNGVQKLIPQKVHIGKSSSGWQFLFNHNDWFYYKDFDSLKEFMLRSVLVDEYDCEISFRDFWRHVANKGSHEAGGKIHFGLCFSDHTDFF